MLLKDKPSDFLVREHYVPKLATGPHTLYLLRKRDWNTEDCLQWLAQSLRLPRKIIGYAGNKDKRAITEQYITIKNGPVTVRTPVDFTVTSLGFMEDQVHMGNHLRNFFTITVRDLPPNTKPPVALNVKNYFGEQRFSTDNVEIGMLLLKKQYKDAATLLGLQFTTDPVSVLRTVPRHTLLLYVHAAQSKLWNELAETIKSDEQDNIPVPGFAPEGNPKYFTQLKIILDKHDLNEESFINRSFSELSLEGGSRLIYQDLKDFSASKIENGVCIVSFSLGKGSYATETIKQIFPE